MISMEGVNNQNLAEYNITACAEKEVIDQNYQQHWKLRDFVLRARQALMPQEFTEECLLTYTRKLRLPFWLFRWSIIRIS